MTTPLPIPSAYSPTISRGSTYACPSSNDQGDMLYILKSAPTNPAFAVASIRRACERIARETKYFYWTKLHASHTKVSWDMCCVEDFV